MYLQQRQYLQSTLILLDVFGRWPHIVFPFDSGTPNVQTSHVTAETVAAWMLFWTATNTVGYYWYL